MNNYGPATQALQRFNKACREYDRVSDFIHRRFGQDREGYALPLGTTPLAVLETRAEAVRDALRELVK